MQLGHQLGGSLSNLQGPKAHKRRGRKTSPQRVWQCRPRLNLLPAQRDLVADETGEALPLHVGEAHAGKVGGGGDVLLCQASQRLGGNDGSAQAQQQTGPAHQAGAGAQAEQGQQQPQRPTYGQVGGDEKSSPKGVSASEVDPLRRESPGAKLGVESSVQKQVAAGEVDPLTRR